MAGCTLTGALSVACFIPGAVTVVHAPKGCAHQTFSMLHAMMNEAETNVVPEILVSGLSDKDVIFGGEDCLRLALDRAAAKDPELIGDPTTGTITELDGIAGDQFTNPTDTVREVVYTITPYAGTCQGSPFTVTVRIAPSVKTSPVWHK